MNNELPLIDISMETRRHVVIAQGTPAIYQGHPTTLLMPDGRTLFCVWNYDHGGCGMARSNDGRRIWIRIDDRLPRAFSSIATVPASTAWSIPAARRLWVFMPTVYAAHCQRGWRRELAGDGCWGACVMTFSSVVRQNGTPRAVPPAHGRGCRAEDRGTAQRGATETADGGVTWSAARHCRRGKPDAVRAVCLPLARWR